MTKTRKSFFARLRQKLFEWRLEWEIYGPIAQHLHCGKDFGYPFTSRRELTEAARDGNSDALTCLAIIEEEAQAMPKAYGEAFRYIAYRDVVERMTRYKILARRRIYPESCDPRLVATKA